MRIIGLGVVALCSALAAIFLAQRLEAESRSFAAPKVKEVRLDWCLHWARDCGKPAADFFCREQGFTQASQFHIDPNAGARGIKTLVAGDGRLCEAPTCSGFRLIVCDRSAPGPAPSAAGPIVPPSSGGKKKPGAAQVSPATPSLKSYQDLNDELQECKAGSDKLRDEIAQLLSQRKQLEKTLAERDKTIADMTSKGGSLVRAYCKSNTVSVNTAGMITTCGTYQCEAVSGLCRNRCTNTNDYCSPGSVCIPETSTCAKCPVCPAGYSANCATGVCEKIE